MKLAQIAALVENGDATTEVAQAERREVETDATPAPYRQDLHQPRQGDAGEVMEQADVRRHLVERRREMTPPHIIEDREGLGIQLRR